MTGYGRGEASAGPIRAAVEIRSVNHRYLDAKIKAPPELSGLEPELQQRLQRAVARGRLDLSVTVARLGEEAAPFEIDRARVASYLKAAGQLQKEYGLSGEVSLQEVLSLPDVIAGRSGASALGAEERRLVVVAVDRALASHDAMRRQEGEILARDIRKRIAAIAKLRDKIARRAPRMVPLYAKRLKARVKELNGSAGQALDLDQSRLAQEVALIAERSDISEELVRLSGYLDQLSGLIQAPREPVGKKLDFIMQELNRETNTINSKAIDLAICQAGIEVKAEVEKIREQAQNIE